MSNVLTFFLNCLYIASSASFIVTPFRFRAVTSSPRGKWRSIFFTGGVVKNFFNASLSSSEPGEVLSFLLLVVSLVLQQQELINTLLPIVSKTLIHT